MYLVHGAGVFCIIGMSYGLPYDTKMLRRDAHANAEEIVA